jgi:uncharacterized membrane protein
LSAALAFIGFSSLAMGLFFQRLDWKGLRWPAIALLPVMGLAAVGIVDQSYIRHPLQGWWLILWPSMFAIHLYLLHCMDSAWNETVALTWHVAGALLAAFLLSWEAGWLLHRLADGSRVWAFVAWGGVPAAIVAALRRLRGRPGWPLAAWTRAYQGWLPFLLVLWLLVWTIAGTGMNGDPRPLGYLPLLNPLDIVQVLAFLVMVSWVLWMAREPVAPAAALAPAVLWTAAGAGGFVWLTAVVARTVHHWNGVPYHAEAMFGSGLFHTAVAVLWGLLALGCMIAANRFRQRAVWFTGAGLLTVVVVKLFVVDLSESGSVSRIVSFLAVGGLMLVIGFVTPLPPAESKGAGA